MPPTTIPRRTRRRRAPPPRLVQWLPAPLVALVYGSSAFDHAGRVVLLHHKAPSASAPAAPACTGTLGRASVVAATSSGPAVADASAAAATSTPSVAPPTHHHHHAPQLHETPAESIPHDPPGTAGAGALALTSVVAVSHHSDPSATHSTLPKSATGTSRRSGRGAGATSGARFQTAGFVDNRITTARYNAATFLPKQLFTQFSKLANLYFLFIAGLQQVPGWSPTGQYTTLLPLVLFVGLAMMREAYDDWLRHKRDDAENKDLVEVLVGGPDDPNGVPAHWEYKAWETVQVGDIVRVKKDKAVPADLVLLRTPLDQGLCYIQTSQLDGESNLKQRQAVPQIQALLNSLDDVASFKAIIEAEDPNEDLYNFDGSVALPDHTKVPLTIGNLLLRGTTLRNTPEAIGMAIFTGEETKIRRNANRNKRTKVPNLEKQTNRVVVIIFACVLLLSIVSTILGAAWDKTVRRYLEFPAFALAKLSPSAAAAVASANTANTASGYVSAFFTFVILYNTMIPISLYVTLEIVKLVQATFMNHDLQMYHEPTDQPAEARTASLNEELGQVSYLFTDKTGTLTENQMLFRQMSVAGIDFLHVSELEETGDASGAAAQQQQQTQPAQAQQQPQQSSGLGAPPTGLSPAFSTAGSTTNVAESLTQLFQATSRGSSSGPTAAGAYRGGDETVLGSAASNTFGAIPLHDDSFSGSKLAGSTSGLGYYASGSGAAASTGIQPGLLGADLAGTMASSGGGSRAAHIPRSTRGLTRHLLEAPHHPLAVRIRFFLQAVALCHQAIPDVDSAASSHTASLTTVEVGGSRGASGSAVNLSASGSDAFPATATATAALAHQADLDKLRAIVYQAASPDEVALVNAAREFGFILSARTTTSMSLLMPGAAGSAKFHILDTIEFSSARKRMSIILRFPDGRIMLLAKGADNAMLERSKPAAEYAGDELDVYSATQAHLDRFASAGLRTLVYAVRHLSEQEYTRWARVYLDASTSVTNRVGKLADAADMIERNWTIIGATGIEDRLQRGVPDTIRTLERANVKVWMVTGDKKETAVSIGFASGLATDDSRLLCIEGMLPDGSDVTDDDLVAQVAKLQDEVTAWEDDAANARRANAAGTGGRSHSQLIRRLSSRGPNRGSTAGGAASASRPRLSSANQAALPTSTNRSNPALLGVGATATAGLAAGDDATAAATSPPPPPSSTTGRTNPFVMVVDGPTIARFYKMGGEPFRQFMALACNSTSVLCCRVSPLQKSLVVRSVRDYKPHVVTAAIGDGANDIAMIQQAHVGIGITGREGMQAARSSDYSLARFRFLTRLLLVHGHWSYIRVAKFTLGTFYKCIMFYCTQAIFQTFSGYSGTSLYEQWTLTMYNIIFSSLPVILLGIFERDLPCSILVEFPELYRIGQRNGEFSTTIFLVWMLKSIMQSVVVMLCTVFMFAVRYPADTALWWSSVAGGVDLGAVRDSYSSLYVMGTVAYTIVVLTATIQICYISPSTITLPLHVCAVLTIGVWFLWQAVYSLVWPMFGVNTGYDQAGIWGQIVYSSNPYNGGGVGEAGLWWAVVLLATTMGVAPEWTFYKLRRYYRPTDVEKLRELDHLRRRAAEQRRVLAPLVEPIPMSATAAQAVVAGAGAGASVTPAGLEGGGTHPHHSHHYGAHPHPSQGAVKLPPTISVSGLLPAGAVAEKSASVVHSPPPPSAPLPPLPTSATDPASPVSEESALLRPSGSPNTGSPVPPSSPLPPIPSASATR
ncbi:drs2 neo1 protein [Blastocladiella emersonii ATCC 22665]|nr:drs2 neo1 protein [Blastocladiella emersonii ATCC 22665]